MTAHVEHGVHDGGVHAEFPRSAPVPLAAAGAARTGALLALALIALGAIGIRDAVVAAGWARGRPWIPAAATALDGLRPAPWIFAVAVAAGLVGAALIAVAIAPRRRTAVPLTAGSAVYLARDDVAKVAAAAARDVPGVLSARATSSTRRVVVRCAVTADDPAVRALVETAVATGLEVLQRVPTIVVRTRAESRS
jgi:hypothetical protein